MKVIIDRATGVAFLDEDSVVVNTTNGNHYYLTQEEQDDMEVNLIAYEAKAPQRALEVCYKNRTASMAQGGYGTWREQSEYRFKFGEEALNEYFQSVKDNIPKPE